jgi:glucuronate isomerase
MLWEEIRSLPVFDTHTHLETSAGVGAQDFFDIAHYFWFRRELTAAGYPQDAEQMPSSERFAAFAAAYRRTRNTTWARMVRRMISDLYAVDITEEGGPERADSAIREKATDETWPEAVCDKAGITEIVTGLHEPNDLDRLGNRVRFVPIYLRNQQELVTRIQGAPNQREACEQVSAEINHTIDEYAADGRRSIRADFPFLGIGKAAYTAAIPDSRGSSEEAIKSFVGHSLMSALAKHRMHVQVFVGMKHPDPAYTSRTNLSRSTSLDDPNRIVEMHEVFDMYQDIDFEIVNAAPGSAMDIVQAARIYPNVYPGGLWWFNFRAGTYRANMQFRMEALPAVRSTLVASDARHIEWAYTKILLVKMLLTEFLEGQIAGGWIDTEVALFVAASWLHDSAAQLYRTTEEDSNGTEI